MQHNVLSIVERLYTLVLTITKNKTGKTEKIYLISHDEIFFWLCLLNLFIKINAFSIK